MKEKLQKALVNYLFGLEAHAEMMPYIRTTASEARTTLNPRESAVCILLFPEGGTIQVLFIERASSKGVHSGQIAFPGGKKETSDLTLMQTALRETEEEVGIPANSIEILGELTEVFIPPSNFVAKPFVGWLTEKPSIVKQESEVHDVFFTDLDALFSAENMGKKELFLPKYEISLNTPYFNASGRTVWGATALMLNELKHIYKSIN